MLARLLGRNKKPRGDQHALASALYGLQRRRTELYIPYLQKRIAELRAAIDQKASR